MKKFCPSCGAETKKFYGNVCVKCHLKKTRLLEAPPEIKIDYCKCGHIKINEYWKKGTSLKKEITTTVRKSVKLNENAKLKIIIPQLEGKSRIKVKLVASIGSIKEEAGMFIALSRQLCGNCSREKSGYYEVILQIRGEKSRHEKTKNFIIKKVQESNDRNAFISKVEYKNEGIDMYIGSKNAANRVINELKKVCDFNIKRSYKIYGMKKGNTLFRSTILLRLER